MEPIRRQGVLWAMADLRADTVPTAAVPTAAVVPLDSLLTRYRESTLRHDERRHLERLLAGSAQARARLTQLSGVGLRHAPAQLRTRLLDRATTPSRPRHWRSALLALAASTLIAFGTWQLPEPVPAQAAFAVTVDGGLAERRAVSGSRDFFAANEILFTVTPESQNLQDLIFGLYRSQGGGLQRVTRGLTTELEGGGARLRIAAQDLLGKEPGSYVVYLAVGSGSLPNYVASASQQNHLAALQHGDLRRIYPQSLTLVAEEPPS